MARDGSILVICEVKTKSSADYGVAKEMVTNKKQEKLSLLGKVIEQQFPNAEIRFDVVAVDYRESHPHIEHIKNAFDNKMSN